jgi:nifR3 family TIM-barrel protein
MAGVTDLPFRRICREHGASMVFTEMISAKGLCLGDRKSLSLLWSDGSDRPLGVQIFGAEPLMLAEAARICQELGADLLDINMGCPVHKVVKQGAGAALLRDLKLIEKIIRDVRLSITIPLTVKIRAGWDSRNIVASEVARICEHNGVDAIIIHPRTRSQGYGSPADWSLIEEAQSMVSIPVIGNGDVFSARDVLRMMASTGCKGVMIGRAARGNPWIFSGAAKLLQGHGDVRGPTLPERLFIIRRHLSAVCAQYPCKKALGVSKNHLLRYLRGVPNGRRLRDRISKANDLSEIMELLELLENSLSDAQEMEPVDHPGRKVEPLLHGSKRIN